MRTHINCKHILLAMMAIAVALFVLAGAAFGEEEDPSVYQPDGIGSLFQGPDLRQGHDPTLFEKYPDSAWYMDWKSQGWTHFKDNAVDPVLNGIANTLMGFTRAVTRASIALSWQMSDFDAFSLVSDQMTDMVGIVSESALSWLLPSCLAIGAVLVLTKANLGTGEGLRQFGALVLTGVVGVSLAVMPGAWTGAIDAIRQVGSSATSSAATAVTTELEAPFAGPTATYGNNEGENSQRQMGDAIWRTYVATPWCIAEFGNLKTCQDFGETLISLSGEEREEYLDGKEVDGVNFREAVGGKDSAAWQMATGQDGATRMAIMFPALIVAVLFCGLVIFLNASMILYLMLALMLLVVGVFFAMMWVIPGKPRQWGMAWIEKLFSFTFMSFIANLILLVTMLIAMATMSLTGSYGWGVSAMLTIIGAFASVLLFRHIKEIMGVSSAGALSALGTGAAIGMIGSRALRAGRKMIPKPRNRSGPNNSQETGRDSQPSPTSPPATASPNAPRPLRRPNPIGPGRGRARPSGPSRRTGLSNQAQARPAPVGSPRLPAGPTGTAGWRGGRPRDEDLPVGPNGQRRKPGQAIEAEYQRVAEKKRSRQTTSANTPHRGPQVKPTSTAIRPAPTAPQARATTPAKPTRPASRVEPRQSTPRPDNRQSRPARVQEATSKQSAMSGPTTNQSGSTTSGSALPGLEGPDAPPARRKRKLPRKDDHAG